MGNLAESSISRRGVLAAGGAVAVSAGLLGAGAGAARAVTTASSGLPDVEIQTILQADGMVSGGVLEVDIDRSDLRVNGPAGVPFRDGFQIQHEFFFQALGAGQALMNGDMALLAAETQTIVQALERLGFVFQAFHQHLYNLSPMVWFIHMRISGPPLELARKAHELVKLTSTPLPQHAPPHPSTPLPADRLASILGGEASIGANGIVTVSVDRTDPITLGGHRILPGLGVSTSVQFQPLGSSGDAAVVPDFAMTSREVAPVISTMRRQGWEIGCLYNQEIDEQPQLFFSHNYKLGDAVALAHEVRRGLDHTNV
jgi:hypothetical protein